MRDTFEVGVGRIGVGGANPVRVQSMTNTPTQDVDATVRQVKELADAGSELVRMTVMDNHGAEKVAQIKKRLVGDGYDVPLVGDFHFNGHLLLERYPDMAGALDKFRINPGNVGFGDKHDPNFKAIVGMAVKYGKPVRIGVNFGSIDQRVYMKLMDENAKDKVQRSSDELAVDAMFISATGSVKKAVEYGMPEDSIVVSAKVSNVPSMLAIYRRLSKAIRQPLHLGLTEAGMGQKGIIASAAGLSGLLQEGIGDTIRVSITPEPGAPRSREVEVAQQILQVNGVRQFMPTVTSCPGCGRTTSSLFQEIAEEITTFLKERTPVWRKAGRKGVEAMTVAVMGCVVNGPGESRHASIGLSLPGAGEDPVSPVYVDGKPVAKLRGDTRIDDFKRMIEEYVVRTYRPS